MDEKLLRALLNKVDEVLNGKSDVPTASKDNYLAWCSPGIPLQPEELQFAIKGINGRDADDQRELMRTAASFARLANSIPSSNTIGGTFEQAGNMVWSAYSNVLQFSKVAKGSITKEEEEKIKKIRESLTVTKTVTAFGETVKKQVDSPEYATYKEKQALYEAAALEYNNKRIAALNTDSKEAVQDFTINATLYRKRVEMAFYDWVSNGYKNECEKAIAYINQVTQRDMALLKADLQRTFDDGVLTDPSGGDKFYFTNLYPGNFLNSKNGWTNFSFKASSKDQYLKETHQATSGSVGISWGLFRLSASGSHSKDELHTSLEASDFEMKFSLTQAVISRPWFSPDFLLNNAWDWDKSTAGKPLSNGGNPPVGSMIAYPTAAVFIKDVTITSSKMKDVYDEVKKAFDVGGSIGWGPFSFGAKHSQSSKEVNASFNAKTNTLSINGMQLLAFKCFALPKTPDCKATELQ